MGPQCGSGAEIGIVCENAAAWRPAVLRSGIYELYKSGFRQFGRAAAQNGG